MTTASPTSPSSPHPSGRPDDGRSRDPLAQATQSVADSTRQLADAGERAVHASLEKVHQGAANAQRTLDRGLASASEVGEDWMCTLKKTVEAHPLVTIAAAIGVGMLLDRFLTGPRH